METTSYEDLGDFHYNGAFPKIRFRAVRHLRCNANPVPSRVKEKWLGRARNALDEPLGVSGHGNRTQLYAIPYSPQKFHKS